MKTAHKALILGVVTEAATVAWYIFARGRTEVPVTLFVLHTPAIFLIRHGAPWLLSVLIEAALWMLFWFLVLRLFASPKDELTSVTFSGIHSERKNHD